MVTLQRTVFRSLKGFGRTLPIATRPSSGSTIWTDTTERKQTIIIISENNIFFSLKYIRFYYLVARKPTNTGKQNFLVFEDFYVFGTMLENEKQSPVTIPDVQDISIPDFSKISWAFQTWKGDILTSIHTYIFIIIVI